MKEIQSLPQSLQAKVEYAKNLLERSQQHSEEGNLPLAMAEARQGLNMLVEVAQRSPELAILAFGAMHGYSGIEFTTTETNTYYEKVEKQLFGMTVSTQFIPMTTTKTTTRSIRFTR